VDILDACAKLYVPGCRKQFFKFWWNEDLNNLKEASVDSNRMWTASGKPRQDPIFYRKKTISAFTVSIRLQEGQRLQNECYTNELHEALMKKDNDFLELLEI